MSSSDAISIISITDEHNNGEIRNKTKPENGITFESKHGLIMDGFYIIAIIAFCLLFTIPWTTIPRTNSIIYQSYWMEVNLPGTTNFMLVAATDLLNLTIWTNERSLMSISVFFRMFLTYLAIWIFLYISIYFVWSIYLGFNHPLPHLGMMILLTYIIFVFCLWFLLPPNLFAKNGFKRKVGIYTLYFFWTIAMAIQNEILSYFFANLPPNFQFIVVFMILAGREFDMKIRKKLVKKMMGDLDEPATVLLAVTISSAYTFFVAIRLVAAELSTVICSVVVDFFLHFRIMHKIVQQRNKVGSATMEPENEETSRLASKLVVAEAIEGLTPIIYAICVAMAYYGPNGYLLGNIRNSYWGYKEIEDISNVFTTMFILFAVDSLSVLVNSFFLWKMKHFEMHREFLRIFKNYWIFMAIKLGFNMSTYFSENDINLGLDGTYKFDWITHDGRMELIYNSTDITAEEKEKLLANFTIQ